MLVLGTEGPTGYCGTQQRIKLRTCDRIISQHAATCADAVTAQPLGTVLTCTCHVYVPCCLLFLLPAQLYTAAVNACMTDDNTNFDAAWEIYTTMQRHGVEPDDLLYGHLIAIAGRCRKLEVREGCAAVCAGQH